MGTNLNRFPTNYLVFMWSPKRIFAVRRHLSWWKLAFIFIFITGCLMMPLTLQLSKMKTVPFSVIAPSVNKTINSDFAEQMKGHTIKNGNLSPFFEYKQKNGRNLLAIDPSSKWKVSGYDYHHSIHGFKNSLVFQTNQVVISDQNGFGFTVSYPKHRILTFSGDKSNMKVLISELWVNQYKQDYLGVMTLICFVGLMISNLILMGMLSFILWITKFTKTTDIHTFKEAVTVVFMCAGCPTITALLISLFSFNLGTMILIQSFGLVIMITLVFWKTHFQNEQFEKKQHLKVVGDEMK
ncbi:DUF1189 domain-containing protein [Terrilactibacillus laevilacticus]|uniref:DUF1189 domain-containing protein n=1 Tax=Terrilactibacillus laevilacticus TaxID=1380157 RepID=A0ABW5PV91_9BACI|nr:DUF1189 family protein [Terrilactibacillus laevilacticus]